MHTCVFATLRDHHVRLSRLLMEIAIPMGVPDVQDARTKIFHQVEKLSGFSRSEQDLYPGGFFSGTGVMAAMAIIAIMAS